MIKAVIADVDGVMVGGREGVNFPLPHGDVLAALKRLDQKGVPVVLCTAKFRPAIGGIIEKAELHNPHITDGGALIINPLGEPKIIEQSLIDRAVVSSYVADSKAYTELYDAEHYYVQQGADPEFLARRIKVLQQEPVLVDSLLEIAETTDIMKIISFSDDDADMPRIEAPARRLGDKLHFIWTEHPFLLPRRPCVMTAPGVSKQSAAAKILDILDVSFDEVLGIGDSASDWSFMQLCGAVGVVGGNEELRKLAGGKPQHYFGKSVDDHGLLEIFGHFNL